MNVVKLYWQEATDEKVRGYYKVNSQGIRTKVDEIEADRIKAKLKPVRTYSNVMTLSGAIPSTHWVK